MSVHLAISTEHGAWLTTARAAPPRSHRPTPVCPCEPTTIRSAPHFSASSMMTRFGFPSTTFAAIRSPALLPSRSFPTARSLPPGE